jgi:hypothetical protein
MVDPQHLGNMLVDPPPIFRPPATFAFVEEQRWDQEHRDYTAAPSSRQMSRMHQYHAGVLRASVMAGQQS